MSMEDPFFVVRDEVQQALITACSLFSRWQDVQQRPSLVSPEEKEYTINELRNSLRSIDWDLEDLEETVDIVEKNPKKFKIDEFELNDRRNFIERARASVQDIRRQMSNPDSSQMNGSHDSGSLQQGLLSSNGLGHPPDHYTQPETEMDRTSHQYVDDTLQQQQQSLIQAHDSQLDRVGASVGVLGGRTHQIGNELEDQSALLDELGQDVEQPETRLNRAMKRLASAVHMSNDHRQWCAIAVLIVCIIILLAVFFTL